MSNIQARNNLISENGKATRLKRLSQVCKSFKFKVDKRNINLHQQECLKMMFVEAKWLYNYLISLDDVFNVDYKALINITHKNKEGEDIPVKLTHLGSSVRQELIKQIIDQIKGLSVLKKKGHHVGRLRFKSDFKSIKFKQYNNTHYLKGNKIKLQGIKQPIRLFGVKQLDKYKDNIDYTTCNLITDGIDYYVVLTCFVDRSFLNKGKVYRDKIVGIDMGIKDNIVLSTGEKINVRIEETGRLKKLQRKLSRQEKRSNNWYKTKSLIQKEHTRITNRKNEASNKLINLLNSNYDKIIMQNEQIDSWKIKKDSIGTFADKNKAKSRNREIQYSILGRLKSKLMHKDNVVILDKWCPTTKYCSNCGSKHKKLSLNERTFICPVCNTIEDRDIHAAKNMIYFYLQYIKNIQDTVGTTDTLKLVKDISWRNLSQKLPKQESTVSLAQC